MTEVPTLRFSEMSEAEVRAMFVARQPMGRLGTAEEVAMLAVYLGFTIAGLAGSALLASVARCLPPMRDVPTRVNAGAEGMAACKT